MCPGEELVLTCRGQGTSQRWHITDDSSTADNINIIFVINEEPGIQELQKMYNFTLLSKVYNNFVSTLSTVATNAIK